MVGEQSPHWPEVGGSGWGGLHGGGAISTLARGGWQWLGRSSWWGNNLHTGPRWVAVAGEVFMVGEQSPHWPEVGGSGWSGGRVVSGFSTLGASGWVEVVHEG